MMDMEAPPRMPWFRMENQPPILLFQRYHGLCFTPWSPQDFWIAVGVSWHSPLSLWMTLLFGPTVSKHYWSFLLFWPHCISLRTLLM